ncbi:MAG TPA: site-2 protease family protein [Solirubrobacteraceae bacterium]|nr:site-2 protease family protein [Solirubrobacteraceae bacterium]
MRPRSNLQLGRIFGVRIGASMSWFLFLFVLIFWLSHFFHEVLGGSQTTAYVVAVAGALGYFLSLVVHELGHALVARRLGIPIAGIDLWFLGGLARMRREPATAGEELKVSAAGPFVTLLVLVACVAATLLVGGSEHTREVLLTTEGAVTTPLLALLGWLGFINAMLLVFNVLPAFPLDGGRIARAVIWARTGDRNRATRATGMAGRGLAILLGVLGLWDFAGHESLLGLMIMVIALFVYQSASAAVLQGTVAGRIQNLTVGDVMDREPVVIPGATSLLDAHDEFFVRYRWPWFAVVDEAGRYLGILRGQSVDAELAAGRPALTAGEVAESDAPVRIGPGASLESLLSSEGLGRLGAMVAVDGDGVLQGVVTAHEIRRAMRPAT